MCPRQAFGQISTLPETLNLTSKFGRSIASTRFMPDHPAEEWYVERVSTQPKPQAFSVPPPIDRYRKRLGYAQAFSCLQPALAT